MVGSILDSAYQWFLLTFQFNISQFWYWVMWGAVISAGVSALAFFFPAFRSFSGAVVMAVIVGLTAYRRGEYDQINKQKLAAKAKKPAPKPDQWKRW